MPGVLKALINGAWVNIPAGMDEVWISPTEPTNPGIELWYDTDEPGATGSFGLEAARPTTPAAPMRYFATDTRRDWLWDGVSWKINGGVLPQAGLLKNAVQNIASAAWTVITWNSTEYDTDTLVSGNTLVAKYAGMWLASYRVTFAAVAAAGRVVPAVVRNGDTYGQSYAAPSVSVAANDDGGISGAQAIRCNAGDTLDVRVYTQAARDFGHTTVFGRFSIIYLSPI